MTEPLVTLRGAGVCFKQPGFGKRKNEHWALRDIDLELVQGETLGVIGRNGGGKSTLLKLLADIIEPDSGYISRTNCRSTLLSLRIGFLNHLDAKQNAIMAGMLLGLKRKEIEQKLPAILDFAELGEAEAKAIGTYSTGMVARLGFSIALQIDPDILLIDEMLAVGDANFREKSAKALRQRMHSDKTVVLVAHNEITISQLCNRVLWIENGKSKMLGETDKVLEAYKRYLEDQPR